MNKSRLEDLFDAGLSLENARVFLVDQCGDDEGLKQELSSLWAHSEAAETLFDVSRLRARGPATAEEDRERGEKYEIVSSIASGGMGTVYKADQRHPIERIVAIKVLDTGLVSEDALARFRFECQVLAMMDHPYIAHVYDSGVTADGDPFFAMEYLDGDPITLYCDRKRLDIIARIELFKLVCEGLQHAHQKGVIHRDIKPSNVLIVEQEGVPIPKIIDFGIAKLADGTRIGDHAETQRGMVMGTPNYMSPEQATKSSRLIDTRTDLYSLGVLLYELLIGVIPLDRELAGESSLEGCCRIILEIDPLPPSRRLDQGDLLTAAAQRLETPRSLSKKLRGDLDWIVLMALHKEPTYRYANCSQLSRDLELHFQNRPVLAGPPSTAYHLRKFLRRYRSRVTSVAVFISLFLVAVGVGIVQEQRAKHQLREVNRYLVEIIKAVVPRTEERATKTEKALTELSREIGDVFEGHPLEEATLRLSLGDAYLNLDIFDGAVREHRHALEIRDDHLGPEHDAWRESVRRFANSLYKAGDYRQAEEHYRRLIPILEKTNGPTDKETLQANCDLALSLWRQNRLEEAEQLLRQVLERSRELPPMTEVVLNTRATLAAILAQTDRLEESDVLYRELIEDVERHTEHETESERVDRLLAARHNYANLLYRMDRYADSAELHRENLEERAAVLFPNNRRTLSSHNSLAWSLFYQEDYDQALVHAETALEGRLRIYGRSHPDTFNSMYLMGKIHVERGELERALSYLEDTRDPPADIRHDKEVLMAENYLADTLMKLGRLDEAETVGRANLEARIEAYGEEDTNTMVSLITLGEIQVRQSRFRDALELFRRASRNGSGYMANYASGYIGYCLLELGRSEEAEQMLLAVHERGRGVIVEKVAAWLVRLYEERGSPEAATRFRK